MENDKLNSLLDKLIERTKTGAVIWTSTSGENQYKAEFKTSAVTVEKFNSIVKHPSSTVPIQRPTYTITVLNDKGTIIEKQKYIDHGNFRSGDEVISKIKQLYDTAYNKHHKIDETLDDLLNELD